MSDPVAALIEQVQHLATELPHKHVQLLAGLLPELDGPTALGRSEANALNPAAAFRGAVGSLWKAWAKAPQVDGGALALMLRTAAATADAMRAAQSLEITWTGPASNQVPVRMNVEVLLDLVESARHRFLLVTFSASSYPPLLEALGQASDRGVDVHLVLETKHDADGGLGKDAADAFAAVRSKVTCWSWPLEQRPPKALMHVKAAVADHHTALVTSANISTKAQETSMELGLVVRGGSVPRRLMDHYQALMAAGVLVKV